MTIVPNHAYFSKWKYSIQLFVTPWTGSGHLSGIGSQFTTDSLLYHKNIYSLVVKSHSRLLTPHTWEQWKQWQTLFSRAPKSLWMVIAVMKLKDTPWKKSYDEPRQHIIKQRHHFANKGQYSEGYFLPSSHVWMCELDHNEGWVSKNLCFRAVVLEKTQECLELQGNQISQF